VILVGYSPHKSDQGAVDLACLLALSDDQPVHVLSVVPAGWGTPAVGDTDRDFQLWAQGEGAEAEAEARAELASHPSVTSDASWVPGRSVPQAILDEAERLRASMLVVGSGASTRHGTISLTSKTDRLLHSSPLPVAIAPKGYAVSPGSRVARVTVAFRGDHTTSALLERVAEICQRTKARLRIVTFAINARRMVTTTVPDAEGAIVAQWVRQASADQQLALDNLAELGMDPAAVEHVVAVGRSWGGAIDQLDWGKGDVLVLGSSMSSSLMARVFLGSSATKIIANSPVPVIVVP
jgi:Universal stress protein UspA and related nucleotide-binding proteins